jgi:hypothetical protein
VYELPRTRTTTVADESRNFIVPSPIDRLFECGGFRS